jgi:peptidyl-tRNA hydrolase
MIDPMHSNPIHSDAEVHAWMDNYQRKHVPLRIGKQVETSRKRGSKKVLVAMQDIDLLLTLSQPIEVL